MILKLRLGRVRITFTVAKVTDVLGVNSRLPDGKHILMWDFDNMKLYQVMERLRATQEFCRLPDIYILRSSPPDNYIAYCFWRCEWARARSIIGMTEGIDENFYKWGVFRKRFTLRVGAKTNIMPECVSVLKGFREENVAVDELKSWVMYETLDGHHEKRGKFIELP